MKFLDDSGLSYFWTKLKAAFARIVHVHASSDVTLMTGYSKPSSGSAIAASDTLNGAVGKLEAKVDAYDDSNYVHKTGAETISGGKTFNSGITCKGSYDKFMASTTAGVYEDSYRILDSSNERHFIIRCYPNGVTSGDYSGCTVLSQFISLKSVSGGTTLWGGGIRLGRAADGKAFCACTSTDASRTNGEDIITRNYFDATVVHKTGTEDIAGIKKFIWGLVGLKSNIDINSGTYTDDHYLYYTFYDQNDVQCGRLVLIYRKDNNGRLLMMSIGKKQATFDESTAFILSINSDNYSRAYFGTSVKCLRPSARGVTLGENSDGYRWGQIYSESSTISTSDERKKQDITSVPSNILDVWGEVDWFQFKLIDSVNEKGDKARIHNGLVAQRIKNIFDKYNLDISKYGLFCYDEWESEDPVFNEHGGEISPGRKAGSLYSIRYEEALCMEAAYMRRENARLKKRIAGLEERLAALELKIS